MQKGERQMAKHTWRSRTREEIEADVRELSARAQVVARDIFSDLCPGSVPADHTIIRLVTALLAFGGECVDTVKIVRADRTGTFH